MTFRAQLTAFRYKAEYNSLLCLNKNNLIFDRQLFVEKNLESEKSLIAKYKIK